MGVAVLLGLLVLCLRATFTISREIQVDGPDITGTMFKNPYGYSGKIWTHPHKNLSDQDCALRGVTTDDPSIQAGRTMDGGVEMSQPFYLTIDGSRNHFESLSRQTNIPYILVEPTSDKGDLNFLSLLAFTEHSKVTYLVEEKYAKGQLTDDLAADIKLTL